MKKLIATALFSALFCTSALAYTHTTEDQADVAQLQKYAQQGNFDEVKALSLKLAKKSNPTGLGYLGYVDTYPLTIKFFEENGTKSTKEDVIRAVFELEQNCVEKHNLTSCRLWEQSQLNGRAYLDKLDILNGERK
ncbi:MULTISPECIES: hypothetical protein [unclassified Lonepinella]|uniref:hypothetical protein n=1 Tax=unclassified Lonepinella TaxID=2642006 RepID=UPI0036DE559E